MEEKEYTYSCDNFITDDFEEMVNYVIGSFSEQSITRDYIRSANDVTLTVDLNDYKLDYIDLLSMNDYHLLPDDFYKTAFDCTYDYIYDTLDESKLYRWNTCTIRIDGYEKEVQFKLKED